MIGILEVGQIVFSKSGRDKGRPFVVICIEEEYAYLADGKIRKVESPKRKKYKHIQKTNDALQWIEQKLIEDRKLTNSEIRKALDIYLAKASI